jgi:hypothetical protein
MNRLQFSLLALILAVFALAVFCAVLISDQEIVASAAVTLELGLLAFGIVGIACRRGGKRIFWVGFTVFGLAYWTASSPALAIWAYGGFQAGSVTLLTEKFLQFLFSHIEFQPRVGMLVEAKWVAAGGGYYPARILEIGDDGQIRVEWVGDSTDQWTPANDVRADWTLRLATGHAVFCILVAFGGGFLARIFLAREKDQDAACRNQVHATRQQS